jgi:Sulfotransferase family
MLRADDLMETAASRSKLHDYGSAPLREGLDVLCRALEAEAALNEIGHEAAETQLLAILGERLRIQDWFRREPSIDEQKIIAPLWVVGLPRSGTSVLSQLLSEDPANRSIRRWEALHPTPPPGLTPDSDDPRIVATRAMLAARYAASPEMMAMNPITVSDPSENSCFLEHTFQSLHFAGLYRVPSYAEYALNCDMRLTYRYFLRTLKLLQWSAPGLRWNLKYPLDLFHLGSIFAEAPDVRVIWTHRDPRRAVPSVASLLAARRRPHTRHIDRHQIGREELRLRAEQVRRGLHFEVPPGSAPIIHVMNRDLLANPEMTVRTLYGELGREFSQPFARALQARLAARPKGKFGHHEYTAEEFGLDRATLEATFGAYIVRFDLYA